MQSVHSVLVSAASIDRPAETFDVAGCTLSANTRVTSLNPPANEPSPQQKRRFTLFARAGMVWKVAVLVVEARRADGT